MRFKLPTLHAGLLFCLLFSFAGCSSKPLEEAIIGKWEEDGMKGDTIEFFSNNTFVMKVDSGQFSGNWTKVGDDRVRVDIIMLGTTTPMVLEDIKISGKRMKLTMEGERTQCTRID